MLISLNKNGFTKLDHVTADIILPLLSTSAQSIFIRIYRQTLGWNKPKDKIAHKHFKRFCNIKRHETINKSVDELLKLKLITVDGEGKGVMKEYGIRLDTLMKYRDRYEAGEFDEHLDLST